MGLTKPCDFSRSFYRYEGNKWLKFLGGVFLVFEIRVRCKEGFVAFEVTLASESNPLSEVEHANIVARFPRINQQLNDLKLKCPVCHGGKFYDTEEIERAIYNILGGKDYLA